MQQFPAIRRAVLAALCASLSLNTVAVSVTCGQPGRDGTTYSANTYYAGSGAATAGTRRVTLGAIRSDSRAASTPVGPGDLILIIQMQGGTFNSVNSAAYGNGTGRGALDQGQAGRYEFAVVTDVNGADLTVRDPLQFSYAAAPATTTAARQTFQVVRVPQHASLTLSGTIRPPVWNGQTGGVLILDAAGTLNMGGATVDASAAGFRGGGGFLGGVLSGRNVQDYASVYAGTASRGAMKGEGYAGTPTLVRGDTNTNGYTGTPSGLAAGDPGYPGGLTVSRGAPGNAGGGGIQHNSAGGGGGNVGQGGGGGYSFGQYRTQAQYDALTAAAKATCRSLTSGATTYYSCQGDGSRDVGGLGGAGLPATPSRLFAGGGGGAGDSNNPPQNPSVSSGGAGGGVILIRAAQITGTGGVLTNGQAGEPAGVDAAGGGGAGGTAVIITAPSALTGVQVEARGGAGGNSGRPLGGNETQGPGGGGGGGAVMLATGVTVTANVSGGAAGLNTPVDGVTNTYGSQSGAGGVGQVAYENEGAPLPGLCIPELTVTKATTTPTRFTNSADATYTLNVMNAAGRSDAQQFTLRDPALPTGFSFARTVNVTLTGGATRTAPNEPAAGSTTPEWGTFTLPGGSSVTVTFDTTLSGPAPGTYQNAAQGVYLDPQRTTETGAATVSYDPAGSADEDVTVYAPPAVTLQKWVRNVTRDGTFDTRGGGQPGDILEYCITYRNTGGYPATQVKLRDAIPPNSDPLTGGYGLNATTEPLGVWLSPDTVTAGSLTPAGTPLTAAADGDAASLSAAGGLLLTSDLTVGAGGSVCFRTRIY
ncbi:DUF11 domain-containing protein [Deinococcus knuensis]|uniref:DUF11 domain-containing protein n=1 Tax=Deinococcus knuensis TaxID=1837380 RepID=A0ABQ2SV42_9DEIO|nr:DUF11 domain-containing protein [Deinococcus knuensis]GGS39857.1 hypothetical protein GCM10008961_34010 [Deinococcus knuensis]